MASLSAAKWGQNGSSLLMSMSLPPVLSMLVQSLYNIVDSMFVAKVSDSAYLAVLYAFPIQNFILSLAVGAGVGLNSYIARKLGAGDRDEADSAVTHGFLLAGVHSLLFVLLGLFFIEPFFQAVHRFGGSALPRCLLYPHRGVPLLRHHFPYHGRENLSIGRPDGVPHAATGPPAPSSTSFSILSSFSGCSASRHGGGGGRGRHHHRADERHAPLSFLLFFSENTTSASKSGDSGSL